MPTKLKVTPKDFFLWLGAMVALYVSATSLILLVHQYINYFFPNTLDYGDTYSGTIRFSIAFLVIVFPLYVWLTRLLHNDIRNIPEKRELWVRRWLIVLTLFVAGATIAIDLIVVINTFLNGDITARFVLKAASIVLVLGSGFWYYLDELRGTWEKQEKASKIIAGVVSLVVLSAVVGAFFIVPSPTNERLLRIDEQKTSDLQNIQSQVVSYWQQKQMLPGALSDLEDPLMGFIAPKDPDTGMPYEYSVVSPKSFKLCATFSVASRSTSTKNVARPTYYGEENWQHAIGNQCFERSIDPQRFPPMKAVPLPYSPQ